MNLPRALFNFSDEFIDPFWLLWPTESPKIIFTFYFFLFLRFKFHWHLRLFFYFFLRFHHLLGWFSFSLLWSLIFSRLSLTLLYSVVQSHFFCVVNYLFHTFILVNPLFFFHVHVRCSFSGPQILCTPTVCSRWIDGCCRRGIEDFRPILGPWVALVYLVLGLDCAICSFLGILFVSSFLYTSGFLSFISLFLFFYL
jgi:hypothetical protein